MPIVITCDQGAPEWHQARAGTCTASMFKVARKLRLASGPNKGQPSADCMNYAFKLAIERISGEALQGDEFETYAMRRGHDLEPDARKAHEQLGVMVRRAGFVTTDDRKFGASVDGLIHPKGGAEYKCLVSPEGLRAILLSDDITDFTDQVQGGMWVAELDYFHFGLYCPALAAIGQELTLKVVDRDDAYITDLVRDLREFDALVDECEHRLRRGAAANAQVLALLAAA